MTTAPFREGHLGSYPFTVRLLAQFLLVPVASVVLKRTPIGAPRTSASFALNYKALSPFASMVQVGNFTVSSTTLAVDVYCSNTVVYSYTKKLKLMYHL